MNLINKRRISCVSLAGIALAVSMGLTGCGEQTALQQLEAGKARMQKKEYKAAVIDFKNALQKDSSLVEARFYLGKALFESGDPQGAWVELNKARDAGYKRDDLVPVMAANLLLLGQVDKFIAEYADVELSSPSRQAELKAALALAYGSKAKYAQAQAAAEAALKADPKNVVAQLAVARLLLVGGDREGAFAQLDRTIKEHPQSSQAWSARADMLLMTGGNPSDALAAYREAVKLQADNIDAQIGIIGLLWRQKDLAGVEQQLAQLNKVQPNGLNYQYYKAMLALERRDLKSAREVAQQLLKLAPDNARFLHLAGMIEYERGAYLQAIAHLSKALQDTRSPMAVRVLLARSQLRAGDATKALSAIQPLLDQQGAKLPADVYNVAADAYFRLGDDAGRRRMNQLAVKADPQNVSGRVAMAMSELQEGRSDQALAALKSIADTASGIEADVVLFIAHMRANRLDDALRVIEGIEKKLPDKPVPAYLRGQLEERRQQLDKAREFYETALRRAPNYQPAAAALAELDAQAGKPAQAVKRFEKLVAAAPDSVDALMALVVARGKAGAPLADIQSQLEAAVKRFPDSEAPRIALARVLLDRKDWKSALAVATEAAVRFPNKAAFQDLIGLAELAGGNLNQATQAFSKFASMQPNSVEPMMRMADVHLARKDFGAVNAQLRKVLAIQPDYLPAHAALVALLRRSGKLDEALAQSKTMQTVLPQDPTGWTYEGEIQADKRNLPAAIAAFRTSMAKRPTGSTAVKLHRALTDSGRTAEADKFEAEWLAKQPGDPVFNFHLGDVALARQQWDRAEASYRKVLAVRPNDPVVLNNLAWLLHRAGKPGALEAAERAVAIEPNSAPLLDTAAEIQAAMGRLDKAIELQRRALTLDPEHGRHRLHYAQYLIKAGKKFEAKAELMKLSELGHAFSEQGEVQKLLSTL